MNNEEPIGGWRERVSLSRCAPDVSDAEVVRRVEETVGRLGDGLQPLAAARRIAVKINAGVDRIVLTDGRQTELTDPAVIEGTIRALRAVTDAELLIGDAATWNNTREIYEKLELPERLARYAGVHLLDFNDSEIASLDTPFNDGMFRRYWLPREVVEADAVISIAKMKAHRSVGCTLSIKNMFGWMPVAIYGAPRHYLHERLVRLPRVLADLARLLKPSLCVVDGIAAANDGEWGGTPMRPGVIVAGTNSVATDAVAARTMGIDPEADFPEHPFFYRRNYILLASRAGVGPVCADRIEVLGPRPEDAVTPFTIKRYQGDGDRADQLRRGAACVRRYREEQAALAERYAGRYLAMTDGNVLYDAPDVRAVQRTEKAAGRTWRDAPQFVVRCVPPDEEIENFDWYDVEADIADRRIGTAQASR